MTSPAFLKHRCHVFRLGRAAGGGGEAVLFGVAPGAVAHADHFAVASRQSLWPMPRHQVNPSPDAPADEVEPLPAGLLDLLNGPIQRPVAPAAGVGEVLVEILVGEVAFVIEVAERGDPACHSSGRH